MISWYVNTEKEITARIHDNFCKEIQNTTLVFNIIHPLSEEMKKDFVVVKIPSLHYFLIISIASESFENWCVVLDYLYLLYPKNPNIITIMSKRHIISMILTLLLPPVCTNGKSDISFLLKAFCNAIDPDPPLCFFIISITFNGSFSKMKPESSSDSLIFDEEFNIGII